ncbi:hypothetical protein SNE40_013568 [Patella caerulea]|uniref:Uncharacterized protein n=1 Tax=Patella caerulea TaxID=87958 RepID=A0AAN8JCK6_PATCE
MLCYKTTPIDSHLPSPCTLLNTREYKSNMPCISGLRNKSYNNFRERLIQKPDIQKYYHDRGSNSLKPFIENQDINVYNQNTKTWDKSKVVDINLNKYRTYKVETDHGTLVRNRFHLKPSKQSSLGSSSSDHFQTTV